jgi:hypothetical protein
VFVAGPRKKRLQLGAWLSAKRGDEMRVMLADIYNWFTEGFDTVLRA